MDIWNKLTGGDLSTSVKSGYLILGPNSSDGTLWRWHADNEDQAVNMAKTFSETTGDGYEIFKYEFCGVVRPATLPTEYVKPPTNE